MRLREDLISAPFPVEFVASEEELRRAVQAALDPSSDLSSIVLADESVTADVLSGAGLDPASLIESPAPVMAIDTWDHATTGGTIALASGRTRDVPAAISGAALRIVPVPMASPRGRRHALPCPAAFDRRHRGAPRVYCLGGRS